MVLAFAGDGIVGASGRVAVVETRPPRFWNSHATWPWSLPFSVLTGRLCPTCGMTTAFAWITRCNLGQSWRANPVGCLIALLIPPVSSWLFVCVWLKRPVGFRSVDRPLMGLLVAIVSASLVFWIIRFLGAPLNPGPSGLPPVFGPG